MSRKAPPIGSIPPSHPETAGSAQSPLSQPLAGRRVGRKVQDPVSLGLRKLWEHVEKEPVPDAMLALLDAIDAARGPENASDGQTAKDGDAVGPPQKKGDGA